MKQDNETLRFVSIKNWSLKSKHVKSEKQFFDSWYNDIMISLWWVIKLNILSIEIVDTIVKMKCFFSSQSILDFKYYFWTSDGIVWQISSTVWNALHIMVNKLLNFSVSIKALKHLINIIIDKLLIRWNLAVLF